MPCDGPSEDEIHMDNLTHMNISLSAGLSALVT